MSRHMFNESLLVESGGCLITSNDTVLSQDPVLRDSPLQLTGRHADHM